MQRLWVQSEVGIGIGIGSAQPSNACPEQGTDAQPRRNQQVCIDMEDASAKKPCNLCQMLHFLISR